MADPAITLGALLATARERLKQAEIPDAALDARLLVEHFTGTAQTDAIARPEQLIDAARLSAVEKALEERLQGKPVHRIIGRRAFYGLDLTLSPGTLEPRPDTEALVDLVLEHARRDHGDDRPWRILDLGTGTGAVALALLSVLPNARAVGVDVSADALATAASNADINGYGSRFTTRRSDWFAGVEGRFDFIVSNPPYIREGDWPGLSREVRDFDPRIALVAGLDGLDAYRAIADGGGRHLATGGMVAVEIGFDQKDMVAEVFAARGFDMLDAARDLAGHDRALIFRTKTAREAG